MAKFKKFTIKITENHLAALRENSIYLSVSKKAWQRGWLAPGKKVKFTAPVFIEPYASQRTGPNFCSLGSFSYTRSSFSCGQTIGRYCAIADGVKVFGPNHPMDRLSMCGFDYSPRLIYVEPARAAGKTFTKTPIKRVTRLPVIGNDVWIGANVSFAQGVRVGNGAVIAAHTIVTRDVPDYAVVAGNPGRIKKYRFDEPMIERLLRSQWWNYSFADFEGMDTVHPEKFLDAFEDRVARGTIRPYAPARIALHTLMKDISAGSLIEDGDEDDEDEDDAEIAAAVEVEAADPVP